MYIANITDDDYNDTLSINNNTSYYNNNMWYVVDMFNISYGIYTN